MKRTALLSFLLWGLSVCPSIIFSGTGFGKEPKSVTFTENKGQVCDQNYQPRPDVLFGGRAGELVFHLRRTGISYQMLKVENWWIEPHDHKNPLAGGRVDSLPDRISSYRVDVEWLDANPAVVIEAEGEAEGYNNYYNQQCPNGIHDVHSYSGVWYHNIYEKVSLHYYNNNGKLKYDFIVQPGGDFQKIRLELKGAEQTSIQENGSVLIKTPYGIIEEDAPLVYQAGKILNACWIIEANVLTLKIEGANNDLPLIIDPGIRLWGTFYGGSAPLEDQQGYDCATDVNGNVYMSGYTANGGGGTIIATVGSHQAFYAGTGDAFLVKFNASGVRQWGTFYGGAGQDWGLSCATDPSGNVFMSGECTEASTVGIASPGAHQTVHGGAVKDTYLVKFNSSGVRQWGTYYGGAGAYPGWEWGGYCAADASGNVYLCGTTNSTGTVIATPGSFQPLFGGARDAFLVKFNGAGVRQWGTYYGEGNYPSTVGDTEEGSACAVDANGNVYLTGTAVGTYTGNSMTTPGTHKPIQGDLQEAYLAKFDANGNRLWGTFYGGSANDEPFDVCTDPFNNVFICGQTRSPSNTGLATPGAFQTAFVTTTVSGIRPDGFLAKFNSSGILQWGTYYGAEENDAALGCSTESLGGVYIAGTTWKSLAPTNPTLLATPGAFMTTQAGISDGMLVKFDASGNREWGTYLGGSAWDNALSCATFSNAVYVCGQTDVTGTLIATPGSHQPIGDGDDAYLIKFLDCPNPPIPVNATPSLNLVRCSGQTTTLMATATGTITWYSTPAGTTALSSGTTVLTSTLSSGTTTLYAEASGTCGINPNRLAITVTISPTPTISVNSGSICAGKSFTITPSGASSYTISGGSFTVSPLATSIYTVTGTGTTGCVNSAGATSTVSVVNPPVMSVNSGSICLGKTFTIVPSGASTYTFSSGSNVVSPASNSSYTITGTGVSGCVNTLGVVSNVSVVSPPTITVNSGAICSGKTFTISPSGANSYTFSGGSALVTPTVNSNYTVTGTGAAGCVNTIGAVCSVSVLPSPTISVTGGSICHGGNFTLTPNGASTYTISGGSSVVSPSITTSYSVTGSSSVGCLSNVVVATVVVHPLPNVMVQATPSAVCVGETAVLMATGANSYTWQPSGNGSSVAVNPSQTTSFTVTGTSSNNCSNTATLVLGVKPFPTVTVNSATTCSGNLVTLSPSLSPNTGVTYTWQPGGSTTIPFSVNPTTTTVYSLSVNLDACITTGTSMVTVVPFITPNTAFSYGGSYCINQMSVAPILSPNFTPGGTFVIPAGLSLNPGTGVVNLFGSQAGIYQVNYYLAASGCSTSASSTASIQVTLPGSLTLPSQLHVLSGESITLTVSGSTTYSWSPPDYLSCTTCSNPVANPPQSTTYCVSSPNDVCVEKTCVNIIVDLGCEGNELVLPNAFSPNGDGNNDEYCLKGWNKCISQFKIMIYNRWGEKVYESEQAEFCWDGYYQGKILNTDVLVYMLKAKLQNGTEISKNGNITLLR